MACCVSHRKLHRKCSQVFRKVSFPSYCHCKFRQQFVCPQICSIPWECWHYRNWVRWMIKSCHKDRGWKGSAAKKKVTERRNHRVHQYSWGKCPDTVENYGGFKCPDVQMFFIHPRYCSVKPCSSIHPLKTRHRQNWNCEAFSATPAKTSRIAHRSACK